MAATGRRTFLYGHDSRCAATGSDAGPSGCPPTASPGAGRTGQPAVRRRRHRLRRPRRQRPPRALNAAGTAFSTSLSSTESPATRQRSRRPSIPEEAGRPSCGHCLRRCRPGFVIWRTGPGNCGRLLTQSAGSVNEWSGQVHAIHQEFWQLHSALCSPCPCLGRDRAVRRQTG